jgi:oligopeptide transport system ATP-binding protein
MTIISVDSLTVEFRTRSGVIRPVDNVSFGVQEGETVAIVGESGSGKTTMALALMRLHPVPPCRYAAGKVVLWRGGEATNLLTLSERAMRQVRGGTIAMVFQDPMTSLNPVRSVGAQIAEAVRLHQQVSWEKARHEAVGMLGEVGIADPERRANQFPHQMSGGMRQRVMIAMALVCHPSVLIADEPTTALDVTVQAQIVELLRDLQRRHGTAIILITHDMGLVAQVAQRVLVMYAGRLVESAGVEELFAEQLMPYTWALLRSLPQTTGLGRSGMRPIDGQPPNLLKLPGGCPFTPRCPFAQPTCHLTRPPLVQRRPAHSSACLLTPEELRRQQRLVEGDLELRS